MNLTEEKLTAITKQVKQLDLNFESINYEKCLIDINNNLIILNKKLNVVIELIAEIDYEKLKNEN